MAEEVRKSFESGREKGRLEGRQAEREAQAAALAAELSLWTETILRLPKLAVKPEVVPGEGMRLGDCRIETEMGSVDLGVRAQLGEIERGFFDRVGGGRAEEGQGVELPAQGQVTPANPATRPVAG